jgi:hypothetical protein
MGGKPLTGFQRPFGEPYARQRAPAVTRHIENKGKCAAQCRNCQLQLQNSFMSGKRLTGFQRQICETYARQIEIAITREERNNTGAKDQIQLIHGERYMKKVSTAIAKFFYGWETANRFSVGEMRRA